MVAVRVVVVSATFFVWAAAYGQIGPVYDDLFDVSTGVIITDHSPLTPIAVPNRIADILGGGDNNPHHDWGIHFGDQGGTGYRHYVSFSTPEPRTIYGIGLQAAHDPDRGWFGRGFSTFELWGDGQLVYTFDTANPYGAIVPPPHSIVEYPYPAWFEIAANFDAPATATHWQAVFVQPGDLYRGHANGPRVSELDGYGAPIAVPEPSVLYLALIAAGGFALFRARNSAS